jgi:site-specific recombinase
MMGDAQTTEAAPAEAIPQAAANLRILEIVKAFAPRVPTDVARSLEKQLLRMQPQGTLPHRLEWAEDMIAWLRADSSFELPEHATVSGRSSSARIWILVEVLRSSPAWRDAFARTVRGILDDTSALQLFARAGLPAEHRFVSEAAERTARTLLPTPPDDGDVAVLLQRLFPNAGAVDWLDEVMPTLIVELFDVCSGGDAASWFVRQRAEAASATALVALRAASMGLEDDVRARMESVDPSRSPFLVLSRLSVDEEETDPARWAHVIKACRAALEEVQDHLERAGVSVDLVFRLEFIGKMLERIEKLLPVARGEATGLEATRLFCALLREAVDDTSLSALLRTNIRLLARRIIERAGETGEHYITESRAEYHKMMASAAGGGGLTAITMVIKVLISGAHLPLFFEGLFASLNYSASFLLMHALGFTLATKQPAMTAATMAASVEEGERQGTHERLVDLVARTSRSQLAAAIGNVGMVVPAALAVHFAWLYTFGTTLASPEKANKIVASLSPIHGGTVFFAAFTGVLLWSSSIAAGWLDNWFVYRRLPEAIAAHRGVRRILGVKRAQQFARGVARNVSAVGGNVSLGFALGMTPVVAAFFGLPLDVRHVTLSTGALVFAGCTLGPYVSATQPMGEAVLGIVIIGTLNFGVSFALALFVALRARAVAKKSLAGLGFAVVKRLFRAPLSFVRPPRVKPATSGGNDLLASGGLDGPTH